MKKYLSIGEVSKIKRISAKSIRYYGQLGILIPAYIIKETGYRYYTVEQLLIIDLIQICLDLGIPLKNFKKYVTDRESVDIRKLLEDGEILVNQKIKNLQAQKQFLSNISIHVERTNKVKHIKNTFTEDIPDRYFLTIDYDKKDLDYKTVTLEYSKLFKQCSALGIADTFNQGIFFFCETSQCKKKIFLEIPKPQIYIENLYFLPGGRFECRILPFEEFCSLDGQHSFCIVQELFDLTISPRERLIEIQKPFK